MGRLGILTALASVGLAIALVPGLTTASAVTAPVDAGRHPRQVVLIDWDGFDPEYLHRAATPNLDALAERGSLSVATGTYKTVPTPRAPPCPLVPIPADPRQRCLRLQPDNEPSQRAEPIPRRPDHRGGSRAARSHRRLRAVVHDP